jgi:hypothetical protein
MIFIEEYTERSIAVVGDTKPHAKQLKSLGGRYNPHLTIDGEKAIGWVFKKGDREKVEEYVKRGVVEKTLLERVRELEERVKILESNRDRE